VNTEKGWMHSLFRVELGRIGGDLCGCLRSACFGKAIYFEGLGEMLILIDSLCDFMGAPERDSVRRSFSGTTENDGADEAVFARRDIVAPETGPQGGKSFKTGEQTNCVFLINIIFRQHSTIQGSVVKKSGDGQAVNKEIYFRSGLELIRMMDEATNGMISEQARI
jgi:hypothetical protein